MARFCTLAVTFHILAMSISSLRGRTFDSIKLIQYPKMYQPEHLELVYSRASIFYC